jgi:light-regulated signal transduction histidine kinase (bacteriophytochrome)
MVPNQTITLRSFRMAELDRVLDVLLHDLRSPLSVASGYVRLLRQDRLDTFEARDKAWTQTATALTRIAHLCDEAVGFLPTAAGSARPIPVAQLTARVRQHCLDRGLTCEDTVSVLDGPVIEAQTDVDRLAEAVAVLVALHHSDAHAARVTITSDAQALVFTVPLPGAVDPPCEDDTYDPWTAPGLSAALACHTISLASGNVRAARDLTISFPLQESHS